MKTILGLVLASLVSVSAMAADWGGRELQESGNAAMKAFQETKGASAFLSVSAIATTVRPQKNAANVVITYKDGTADKTQKFFCHTHDTEIECQ